MKKVFTILLISASFIVVNARAAEEHPCKKVHEACSAAGYVKGGAKNGKGIMKHCMKPLLAGQTVAGVNVAAADLEACKAKRAEKHH